LHVLTAALLSVFNLIPTLTLRKTLLRKRNLIRPSKRFRTREISFHRNRQQPQKPTKISKSKPILEKPGSTSLKKTCLKPIVSTRNSRQTRKTITRSSVRIASKRSGKRPLRPSDFKKRASFVLRS